MLSIEQMFVEWVGRQPVDEKFRYFDSCDCAFARFLSDVGLAQNPLVGGTTWTDIDTPRVWHEIPSRLQAALTRSASTSPDLAPTFGHLASVLASLPRPAAGVGTEGQLEDIAAVSSNREGGR